MRVDEMALTSDATLLLAANNADDPPFATLFAANGKSPKTNVTIIGKITVDPSIMPSTFGLSLEQPAWDPTTARFYNSIPIIANNPTGCNYGQLSGPITCQGGTLVIDPTTIKSGTNTLGVCGALLEGRTTKRRRHSRRAYFRLTALTRRVAASLRHVCLIRHLESLAGSGLL
jgi:hypothetical protein